ncbi:hypothetical protein A2Z00_04290 [Candidatus Gottesmanbacteria bacterium RBG_13_45_10]|uniref:LytR/CpsA/Psr regulator C-terminal domain-containing protein n=1 Tax=Candidatus Gottesmanbacteria bacterium RBG_13_45_10 TaxID=1798370 RepID=A0A1F5ZHU3_9BACT|nr:MAG: hypothetical protein A2Z00_04290 [Candidatus Gottesmanbacteria bacterium RBG_13_45_10]
MVFPKLSALSKQQKLIALGVGILFLAIIPSVYFITQYRSMQARLRDPAKYAQQESNAMIARVAGLMALPTDETPTVAIVNDVEKLKNQQFFSHSANGDRVLIYTKAKKAILYRPSINKIIDVAPLNVNQTASESAQAGTTPIPSPATFFLTNGTSIVGLTKKYEEELKSKLRNASVIDRDNAKRTTYDKTLLVDVAGNKSELAQQLGQVLGVEVSKLPEGEATPSALSDFLIIIGADKK